ncbi:MAG TPA: hypothetical protein VFM51_06480 [Solirubrobacterales bacterium]|nr:hypothetical protein [Solirubrobacterales bacterium]
MPRLKVLLALVVTLSLLIAPAGAQAAPRGFFGIAPQTPIDRDDTSRMRVGGLETIRAPLHWASVQRTPGGEFDWSAFDPIVEVAAAGRLEVLPFLCDPPRWAVRPGTRLPIDSGRQRRAWAEFARAAVERYGPQGSFWSEHGPGSAKPLPWFPIHAWQIWNEENFFYFTRPASPTRYAKLLTISDRAIHRADPRATIVMGGLFGNPKQRPPAAMDAVDFLDRLYRVRGIKSRFDAVALHPYAADAGELRQLVERVRGVMLRNRDRRAGLYLTEIGWGSQYNPRVVAFEVGLRGQARELRAAYDYLLANRRRLNLKQVVWFSWKDATKLCSFCDSVGFFRRGARFKPKPAWHVFVSITRRA